MHLHIDLVLTVYCGAALYKIPDWAICILSKAAGICLLEITFAKQYIGLRSSDCIISCIIKIGTAR